jgi:hypothetical protein
MHEYQRDEIHIYRLIPTSRKLLDFFTSSGFRRGLYIYIHHIPSVPQVWELFLLSASFSLLPSSLINQNSGIEFSYCYFGFRERHIKTMFIVTHRPSYFNYQREIKMCSLQCAMACSFQTCQRWVVMEIRCPSDKIWVRNIKWNIKLEWQKKWSNYMHELG